MLVQRLDFFLRQVKPLSGLKLVLLCFFDLIAISPRWERSLSFRRGRRRWVRVSVLNSLLSFRSSFSISRTCFRESLDVIFSISFESSFTAEESLSRVRSSSTLSFFFSSS